MSLIPTKILPPGYQPWRTLSLLDRKNLLLVNIWGLVIFFASAVFYPRVAGWLSSSGDVGVGITMTGLSDAGGFLIMLLAVTAVMLLVHEGLHGFFFWYFTRERPKFAFKVFYAYAALPDWYLPRRQYLISALAPLVGITLLGVLGLALLPGWADPPLIWLLVLNTSGAVGDLWVALALLRAPAGVLGKDSGDSSELFVPIHSLGSNDSSLS
jgi:hypothetical protein